MTEIICVGDIHVSDTPPINCTETYTDDILEMLRWIADTAVEREADAVIWAGDIFDKKAPTKNSHALVLKMIGVVKYYQEMGVDLYVVPGNHDLVNDRYETLHASQPLGVLIAAGLKELSGWHPDLPVFGIPWQQDWPNDLQMAFAGYRERVPYPYEQPLVVTHASIFPPGKEPIYEHLTSEAVADAMGNAGHIQFGHIHDDYGIWVTEGVAFANVGAISRGSLTESHMNREVKVVSWTRDGFEEIVVPHRPAEEVFKVVEGTKKKQEKLETMDFLAAIGHSQIAMTTTTAIVDHIRSMEAEQEVKDTAINLIEAAE